ncbi:MAG TPA: YciI family protein [Candidatus Saccharimonadales bacterium]|nr:YciI family protein [Candidatus Saccharimonadales bacterium]HSX27488.1 YciI family protein [Patescibacteria group bacterium]
MKKFILLYNGPATPPEQMAPEKSKAEMAKWGAWMDKIGDAMVDFGQPMANGVAVVDDGSDGKASQLSGYSIVQADDMESAKKLVDGHPFLSDKSGKFSVEIHELFPAPGM